MNKFYVTTPIFYVNDKPHIGHAFTGIIADVMARYHRLLGDKTFFLTGTDEHGSKIVQAAEKNGKTPQEFTDLISSKFVELARVLGLSNDDFIRTTDKANHWPGVLKIWDTIKTNGDLYKGEYEGFYCVGHEAFVKKSELTDGVCPDHQTKPEVIKEENYFFKLKRYKDQLKKKYENGMIQVKPASRTNEVLSMLADSEDVSFSRPRKDLEWGIPVPGDDSQTIYVWADALTNYLSAIGYGRNDDYKNLWPADVQVIGKDILRFHAIIWPAMLLSAGLELPKSLFVHGFITVEGEKMSKTVGNVIDPIELVQKYGLDPVRYFLLREIPSSEDGNFSYKKFEERYNGDLANNLGNLVGRVTKLIETKLESELNFEDRFIEKENYKVEQTVDDARENYREHINEFKLHEALGDIWSLFEFANSYIDFKKPWAEVSDDPDHFIKTMTSLVYVLVNSIQMLEPFMPETADRIFKTLGFDKETKALDGFKFVITKSEPLFPRLK